MKKKQENYINKESISKQEFDLIMEITKIRLNNKITQKELANLTGINVNLLIIVMGVIAIIYSYTGGLKSVLWTDFIQGSVLLIGVTFALIYLLSSIDGGAGAVFDT